MKTAETLSIEGLLRNYYPISIAGQKLNKFRGRSLAFECVVECGSIRSGIVDCVRIDETLTNEKRTRICSIARHPDAPYYNGISPPCGKTTSECPELCTSTQCRFNSYLIECTNDILITCYEIKVTKSDFHSSNGHNFCGNANYYVMPKELYVQVKDEIPDYIGVIIHRTTDKISDLHRIKECTYKEMSHIDMMWMVLNVLKKNRIR